MVRVVPTAMHTNPSLIHTLDYDPPELSGHAPAITLTHERMHTMIRGIIRYMDVVRHEDFTNIMIWL